MSYGFACINDSGYLMFSDSTYNLSYAGKATYTGNQGFWQYYSYYSLSDIPPNVRYNTPIGELFYYTFDSGGADTIFLVYSPPPAFSAVLLAQKSGTTYSITVTSQPSAGRGAIPPSLIPQVYAFSKPNGPPPEAGYGLNIYDRFGQSCFSTNSDPLIVKNVYNAEYGPSNLQLIPARSPYTGHGPLNQHYIYTSSPLNTPQPVSKPLVYCPSHETGTFNRWLGGSSGEYTFWELCARYHNGNLETSWIRTFGTIASISNPYYNRPSRLGFAFVADAADYGG